MNVRRMIDIRVFLHEHPRPPKPLHQVVIHRSNMRPWRHKRGGMCETCPHRLKPGVNCPPIVHEVLRAFIDGDYARTGKPHGCHEEEGAFCKGHVLELKLVEVA